jgi:hypothetical protein
MSIPATASAKFGILDASESARLRNGFAGHTLRRDRLWRAPAFERRVLQAFIAVAVLVNLLWIVGLDHVMQPISMAEPDRGPIQVSIIEPEPIFELPPEPQPAPIEFRQRKSAIAIEPPVTKMTPPPLNASTSQETQARIGSAGEGEIHLFNTDGSLRLPDAKTRIGAEAIANPEEAGKARWAEIQKRGENPLDCTRTKFAGAFRRDESLGDEVSRKYLKWIGLADGAGIAERAAKREQRAANGCDPN